MATSPKRQRESGAKKTPPRSRAQVRHKRPEGLSFWDWLESVPWQTVLGLLMLLFSALILIAITSYIFTGKEDQSLLDVAAGESVRHVLGSGGAWGADLLVNQLFGYATSVFAFYLLYLSCGLLGWRRQPSLMKDFGRFALATFGSLWGASFLDSIEWNTYSRVGYGWGGRIGYTLAEWLRMHLGTLGLWLVLIFSLLIVLTLSSNTFHAWLTKWQLPNRLGLPSFSFSFFKKKRTNPQSVESLEESTRAVASEARETPSPTRRQAEPLPEEAVATPPREPVLHAQQAQEPAGEEAIAADELLIQKAPSDDLLNELEVDESLPPGVRLKHYRKPPIDLLKDYDTGGDVDRSEIERNKNLIVATLNEFKVSVSPKTATVGPTVTLYEVLPTAGVKIERIVSLRDNIALALKSEGVRIIPMPLQGTVGIEVPNSHPEIVSMRSLLASRRFKEAQEKMELPIGIGKTITNEPFIFDLTKTPHLLVGGATGQGKSVGLNAIITSLLYTKRPEELKFVMIDPKMLEFSGYESLKNHFMIKIPEMEPSYIITDMNWVVPTLQSLCQEMDNRYVKLSEARVKNIKEYNEAFLDGRLSRASGHDLMPYIVLIIDEFADLIMTAGKEVEMPIARLAQKARAAGIHMIIATQRPSVKVITGLIKSNFPARLSFKVVQGNDSKIILDEVGAEHLIGRGDMLFAQGSNTQRLQCAFMSNEETEALIEHIAEQEFEGQQPTLPPMPRDNEGAARGGGGGSLSEPLDPLFLEVARLVVETGQGSVSAIQRRFSIGFNRAGRIMDQLERKGVVGPQQGARPREILIHDLMDLDELLVD